MGFRSEEEALRAKNRALEDALSEARRSLDVIQPRLEQVERLERELADTHAALAKLTGPTKSRRSVLLAAGAALVAVSLLLGVAVSMRHQQLDARRAEVEMLRHAEQDAAHVRALQDQRSALAAEAEAARVAAEAASRAAPPEPYAVRTGRVVSVTGPAPAAEGAACTLTLEPAPDENFDARLRVECAGRTVYGAPGFGYLPCTFEQDRPLRCEDRTGSNPDGDPMVVLDLGTHTAMLGDGPELPWTLSIALTPGVPAP